MLEIDHSSLQFVSCHGQFQEIKFGSFVKFQLSNFVPENLEVDRSCRCQWQTYVCAVKVLPTMQLLVRATELPVEFQREIGSDLDI